MGVNQNVCTCNKFSFRRKKQVRLKLFKVKRNLHSLTSLSRYWTTSASIHNFVPRTISLSGEERHVWTNVALLSQIEKERIFYLFMPRFLTKSAFSIIHITLTSSPSGEKKTCSAKNSQREMDFAFFNLYNCLGILLHPRLSKRLYLWQFLPEMKDLIGQMLQNFLELKMRTDFFNPCICPKV